MMKISAVQLYGLPKCSKTISRLLQSTNVAHLELNIVDENDLEFIEKECSAQNISFSGVHCNLKILEQLSGRSQLCPEVLSRNRIIVPTAVEENTLIWPLSFFRRFPKFYNLIRNIIDQLKFKSCRRVVAGEKLKHISYFTEKFWNQFAKSLNELNTEKREVGFHNHGFEFETLKEGKTPFDILDQELVRDIFFQFDITNCMMSGHYSIELIKKYQHRIKSYHLRIEGPGTEQFYEDIISKHPDVFHGRELVVELKEKDEESMIARVQWWSNLVSNIS